MALAERATLRRDYGDRRRGGSTESEEQEGEDIIFDQSPVKVICPHCGLSIITYIEYESSWLTYLAALVSLMTLGWAAICVVPIIFPLFKDVVHHCPRCLHVLATRSRLAISGFKSEVMSLRLGSCVVVLARKWVLLFVGLMVLIGGIHFIRNSQQPFTDGADMPQRGAVVPLTWADFVKDCGYKSYLGNPIHVSMAFSEKYKNQTFQWHGEALHVLEGFNLFWLSQRTAIYVRMDPASNGGHPDLVLLAGNDKVGADAAKLQPKAPFGFEATMVELGKRRMPHTMMVWELLPAPASQQHRAEGEATTQAPAEAKPSGAAALADAGAGSKPESQPAAPKPNATNAQTAGGDAGSAAPTDLLHE